MDIPKVIHQAKVFHQQKNYPEAIKCYEAILKTDADHQEVLLLLGNAYYAIKEYPHAITNLKKTLLLDDRQPLALLKLGQSFIKTEEYEFAEAPLLRVTEIAPQFAEGYFHFGRLRKLQENYEDAAKLYEIAIKLKPQYPAALNNLGNVYQLDGEEDKAIACYERLIKIEPNLAMAHCNLASLWKTKGRFEKAKQGYIFSLQLDPNLELAYFNLGNLSSEKHDHVEAERYYRKALKAKADYGEAQMALAQNLDVQSRPFDSLEALNKALEMDKKFDLQVKYKRGTLHLKSAQWDNYETLVGDLNEAVREYISKEDTKENLATYDINYFNGDMATHLEMARIQADQISKIVSKYRDNEPFQHHSRKGRKIRIGYVSPDFRLHAVGRIMRSYFKYHNREQFEIYAYSLVTTGDFIEQEIKRGCDHFIDLSDIDDVEAATRINRDQIDVLIDLAVYTKHAKPSIFALRPAPLQMTFVGYPGTSGADYMDYIIADEIILPSSSQAFYTEKPLYLPCAWMAPEIQVKPGKLSRKELELPEEAVVYAAFNSVYKVNPEVFDAWMEILRQVPGSVLFMTHTEDRIQNNLRKEAEKRSVSAERLHFGKFLEEEDYMARFALCDLYLDTFSYTAGSSGIFSLLGGLPVLTLLGETNARRMSASIVGNAGLEEMVCETKEVYIKKAIELGKEPSKREELKNKLKRNHGTALLFDNARVVQSLERTLLEIL